MLLLSGFPSARWPQSLLLPSNGVSNAESAASSSAFCFFSSAFTSRSSRGFFLSELVDVKTRLQLFWFSQKIWWKSSPVNTAFSILFLHQFPFHPVLWDRTETSQNPIDPPWVLHPAVQPVRGLALGPTSKIFRSNGITTISSPQVRDGIHGSSLKTSICCTYSWNHRTDCLGHPMASPFASGSLKFDPLISTQLADLRKPEASKNSAELGT